MEDNEEIVEEEDLHVMGDGMIEETVMMMTTMQMQDLGLHLDKGSVWTSSMHQEMSLDGRKGLRWSDEGDIRMKV